MKFPRPRFSLRTLALLVLLCASGFGLWWRWEPWVLEWTSRDCIANCDWSAEFSPDGQRIILAGNSANLFDVRMQTLEKIWNDGINCATFSHDGRRLFISALNNAFILDLFTNKVERQLSDAEGWMRFAAFSADDRRVWAINEYGVFLWDTDSGKLVRLLRDKDQKYTSTQTDGTVREINAGMYESQLWSMAEECGIPPWVMRTSYVSLQKKVQKVWGNGNRPPQWWQTQINSFFSSPSGDCAAGASDCSELRLLNRRNNQAHSYALGSNCIIESGCFSYDDQRFLFSDGSGNVRLWNSATGAELQVFSGAKLAVAFSPDSQRLITANESPDTISVWHRRRPEYWWGIAWLPEFWLALVFGGGLVWSLRRERRKREAA